MVMFHKGEHLELASFHKNGDVSKGEPLELVSIKMVMFHKGEPLELVSIKMVMFHKGEP